MSGVGDDASERARAAAQAQTKLPKRFYRSVAVLELSDGYGISLDERPVRTPQQNLLVLPTRALADAIAAEWDAQTDVIDPGRMPLTKLGNTAIDRIADDADKMIGEIVAFTQSDLLCYRAADPVKLVELQSRHWDPILRFAEGFLGVSFKVTNRIIHVSQPPDIARKFIDHLRGLTGCQMAAMHGLTTLTGSALIAFAVAEKGIDSDAAWAAANLDEDWQISQWGEDYEAAARRAHRFNDYQAICQMLALV